MLGKRRRNGHGGGNKTNGFPTHTFTEGEEITHRRLILKKLPPPLMQELYRHSQLLFFQVLGESLPEHTVSLTCRREVNCTSSTVRHGRRKERHCRLFPKEFVCVSPSNNVLPALSLSSWGFTAATVVTPDDDSPSSDAASASASSVAALRRWWWNGSCIISCKIVFLIYFLFLLIVSITWCSFKCLSSSACMTPNESCRPKVNAFAAKQQAATTQPQPPSG